MLSSYPTWITCPTCGRHGHILFPNSNTTAEYTSQQEVLVALKVFRENGYINRLSQGTLVDQVTASSLPLFIKWDKVEHDSRYVAWKRVKEIMCRLIQHKRQRWPCLEPIFFEEADYCRLAEILKPFSFEKNEVANLH